MLFEKSTFSLNVPPFIWISNMSHFFRFNPVSKILDAPIQRIIEQYFLIFFNSFSESIFISPSSTFEFKCRDLDFENAFFFDLYQFL
mmetsp:Transcript_79654/g.129155  ORF Transcript_79654/g.129155 Transcript_79654/m.129155 type:complete len:87 (+) Transcript_79654:3127-3387(+)